jgi:hypothetical protein
VKLRTVLWRLEQEICPEDNFATMNHVEDRLCGLVVRVLGYRFGGPGFDSQALQDFSTKKKNK